MIKINKGIQSIVLLCTLISTTITQDYSLIKGTRHKLINTTYYLGRSYEYAYDQYYWTMACIKYYNSTYNQTSAVFVQTGYYFYKNDWAGSEVFTVIFKIDPVRTAPKPAQIFYFDVIVFFLIFLRKLNTILWSPNKKGT